MKYKSTLIRGFEENSFSVTCFYKKNKNAMLYEINLAGHEKANKDYYIERQGYYTYLINYTHSGEGVMQYRGQETTLKQGDLVFIDCNEKHLFKCPSGSWEFSYLHVSGLGIIYLYESFLQATGNVYHGYPSNVFIKQVANACKFLKSLKEENDSVKDRFVVGAYDDLDCCKISDFAYNVLSDIAKNLTKLKREVSYPIARALDYIKDNYNRKISLEEVAEYACLSKYHFERLFTESVGVTVGKYVNNVRLDKARWLLDTTNKSILDIAVEVGYSDVQGLNKLFKKNVNMTPAEYRRQKYHY